MGKRKDNKKKREEEEEEIKKSIFVEVLSLFSLF
jgi:hypothetical protein